MKKKKISITNMERNTVSKGKNLFRWDGKKPEKLKNNQTSSNLHKRVNLTGSKLFVAAGLSHLHLPEHSLLANLTLSQDPLIVIHLF